MVTIQNIHAREILDSRGNPTVEVDLYTNEKSTFRAAVPSGASTGVYEAVELRDGDKARFMGKGVKTAINNVKNIIAPALIGMDVTKQSQIDNMMVQTLDGSQNQWGYNKSVLGANAILAVSMAVCRAGAASQKIPLYKYIESLTKTTTAKTIMPLPCFNVINGGSHAGNKLGVQEFMLMPTGAHSFAEAVQMGAEVYQILKGLLKKKYGLDATNVGDEGGFAPNVNTPQEALELLVEAIQKAGYTDKIKIGLDAAASEFYNGETDMYDLNFKTENNDGAQKYTGEQLMNEYQSYVNKFPIISIEDPFDQDDWANFTKMTEMMGSSCQIVGDDLLVTNKARLEKGVTEKTCNSLLLKLNQIGTVTEAITACEYAQENNWSVMVSHRSGETEDTFIADLVVGLHAGQIKTGAPCRSERTAKYNQLIRIEEAAADEAVYVGEAYHNPAKQNFAN